MALLVTTLSPLPLPLLLLLAGCSCLSVQEKPPVRKVVTAGEELSLTCELQPELGGLVVWKHGARVLFAGDLRIRRDDRLAVRDRR